MFIKAIDTGSRQVMIEARVVEAQDTFNRDLGVRLNFLSTTRSQLGGSGTYAGGGVMLAVGPGYPRPLASICHPSPMSAARWRSRCSIPH